MPIHAQDREPSSAEADARRAIAATHVDDGAAGVSGLLQRLCRAAVAELDLRGAVIHLMSARPGPGVVAGSDAEVLELGDLEFRFGEGPGLEAFAARRPILIPDLLGVHGYRWPGYSDAALTAGVGAVFALPLHLGAVAFGALQLYRDQPGSLAGGELALALAFAGIATEVLLDGTLVEQDGGLVHELARALDHNGEIAQAQGMVMVDLSVSLPEALARLRAHAFSSEVSLVALARRIIAGERLPGGPESPAGSRVEE